MFVGTNDWTRLCSDAIFASTKMADDVHHVRMAVDEHGGG